MTPRTILRLDAALRLAAPILGVQDLGPASSPRFAVDFDPSATAAQRAAAASVVGAFDADDDAAQSAWEADQAPERRDLRASAVAAIQANADYLALGTPTTAQAVVQVRRLTQQSTAIIKRLIQID